VSGGRATAVAADAGRQVANLTLDGKLVIAIAALDNIGTTTPLASSVSLSAVMTLFTAIALLMMWVPARSANAAERRAALLGRRITKLQKSTLGLPVPLWLWFSYAIVSLAWVQDLGKWAVQNLCVYGSFLFAADLGARFATIDRAKNLMRALCWVVWIISLVYLTSVGIYGLGATQILRSRGTAIENAILAGACIIAARGLRLKVARWLPPVLLVAVILSLSRMSLAITILALFAGFSVTGKSHKAIMSSATFKKLLLGTLTGGAAFIYLVLNWAPLHNRFVGGDNASIGGVQINTSGRASMWSKLWDNAVLQFNHVLFGQGPASSEIFVQKNVDTSQLRSVADPHNDYLRMFYDYGIVGEILFVTGMIMLLYRIYRWAKNESVRDVAMIHWTAFLSGGALMGCMITDNPVVYPFCMLPFAALVGMSMGLARKSAFQGTDVLHEIQPPGLGSAVAGPGLWPSTG
jgi:O-antigen ligase